MEQPNIKTAAPDNSIWKSLSENDFREHLVTLEARTNTVPIRPALFPLQSVRADPEQKTYSLSLIDESSLANDLAYIAAIGEGAQSVSAVCIEEHHVPGHLCIRFAAADIIDDQFKVGIEEVGKILMSSTSIETAPRLPPIDALLERILSLHTQKLLGRLRSEKWQKPVYLSRTHKKRLWEDFENLFHRVEHVHPGKRNSRLRAQVLQEMQRLQSTLKAFEISTGCMTSSLRDIVFSCYDFCQIRVIKNFAAELESITQPTSQVSAALKTIHQIEKIGAYIRIAKDLLLMAQSYPDIFRDIRFKYLTPYKAMPTEIGYERWARTLHVHAEIQLAVYYDQRVDDNDQYNFLPPRTIGTSKHLCYLCFLFLKHHNTFPPANTHGRLYDQWTVPDLESYTQDTRIRYSSVIKAMDDEIVDLTSRTAPRDGKREAWRSEPMTSRQDLLSLDGSEQGNDVNSNKAITDGQQRDRV